MTVESPIDRAPRRKRSRTSLRCLHRDSHGRIIWASNFGDLPRPVARGSNLERHLLRDPSLFVGNAWADQGEQDILDVYFDTQAVRANLYARFYNDTPVETDTLATLTGEPSGNGYGALTYARGTDWGAPALDAGDYQTVGATKTLTASGGSIGPVTYVVFATVATGTVGLLIYYVQLSQTRTLADTETLDLTPTVKAQ